MTTSLALHRHEHVIVQNRHTCVADAALAMKTNEVGCVLVSDGREVVGMVTDRDIAIRVVGAGRSPLSVELDAIMSAPIVVLDAGASHDAAVRLMREKRIRRLPLVEGKRVVGMLTLDDLILERAVTLAEITEIVRAQVIHPGPARTRRFDEWKSLARRHARALGTKVSFLQVIRRRAGLSSNRKAEIAAEAVLEALVRSLDGPVAADLVARLPVAFRGRLRDLSHADADAVTSRAECEARIARALEVDPASARTIVDAVGAALAPILRSADPIGRRLPKDLRSMLREASPRPSKVSRSEPTSSLRARG